VTDAVDVSMATRSLDNDTGIRRPVVIEDYGYAAREATARDAVWDAHCRNYSNQAREATKNKLHIAKTHGYNKNASVSSTGDRGKVRSKGNVLEFEVITAVVMSYIFWDTTPCSPLKVNQCFGGTCRLHLQG
jgi:hypothetical protein